MKPVSLFPFLLFSPFFAIANQEGSPSTSNSNSDIEVIEVKNVRQKLSDAGRLKDVIQQTEMLDELMIQNKNALSLTQAINNEPGVNVSNECSMCGVKRVMLNGMKGEHTTILVDGIPTHTLISGFYAVDAIATTGVERIEIARGAGASLIAPEAIGGTVNIVTKQATGNTLSVDVAKGSHDFTAFKGAATAVSEDGKTGITLIGQYDKQDQEDHDDNGVSEAPFIENQSLTALVSQDFNDKHNLQVRVSKVNSEIFGGPVIDELTGSIGQTLAGFDGIESPQLFVNDDVREDYIGKPWETAEWIKTSRTEAYVKVLSELNSSTTSEYAVSYAKHDQDSFYEGIDYVAEDTMTFARAKFDTYINESHFLTYGADIRHEEMRSDTDALRDLADYQSDSFDYTTAGIFIKDTWLPNDSLEIALALRIDDVEADFIDEDKPGVEIDETFFAPRVDARYFHTDELTSRLSVGKGYRAPLSFFETDHGILDAEKGYLVDIDKLEESLSASYSLSYNNQALAITATAAHSRVDNLASLEETADGVPILTQLDEQASVTTVDINTGYQVNDNVHLAFSAERFIYDSEFKSSYGVAPVEGRLSFDLDWTIGNAKLFWTSTWFSSRDLNDYGYEGFNILNDASSVKPRSADAFSISNLRVQYALSQSTRVYGGVSNLFEYTQVEEGDSPLFYDADGGYDVAYIYGPLHGREFYVGIEVSL